MSSAPGTSLGEPARGKSFLVPIRADKGLRHAARVWWSEVDRTLILLIVLMMAVGAAAVFAASPAAVPQAFEDPATSPQYFFKRQIAWQFAGLMLMLTISFLSRDNARRAGILMALIMFGLLLLVPLIGETKKGATRWLYVGMSLQPSEFLKPGFAIAIAWILSWRQRDPNLPVLYYVTGITLAISCLLMLQPNLGETLLFVGTWFVLIFLAGLALWRIAAFFAVGMGGLALVYMFYKNGRDRIDSFLGGGTAFDQVDLANRTLSDGGWLGKGLTLGTRKNNLPEPHTDYIFSVIGEEFGLITCLLVVCLYLAIIARVLVRMASEEKLFPLLAGAGLIAQFGGQAFVNMLVNLKLAPATGSTLPLVSYGGSSMLAVCFTLGLLLAITRRNPYLERNTPGLRAVVERTAADRIRSQSTRFQGASSEHKEHAG
ncbi:MAG: putative peptidoglycan glycosyltransferase FtsW [Pseudomonadota bacterium]